MKIFSLLSHGPGHDVVEVEYHSRFQIPAFQILGLAAPEIQEAKERIMAAFQASALEFPKRKVIINLSPASVRKSGTGHDLSIALKIMSEIIDREWPSEAIAWGELSLQGVVKPARKMATLIQLLVEKFLSSPPFIFLNREDYQNFHRLMHWRKNHGLPIPLDFRVQIVDRLEDLTKPLAPMACEFSANADDVEEVTSHPLLLPLPRMAERVMKISLVGKHHVLLLGPKGVGKSESIRWYQALLPKSSPEHTWQRFLTSEYRGIHLDFEAPVRRVHAQVKPAHLLGSFQERGYLPGELALAHGGLFVADEFVEWPRDSKECLREPLQIKKVFLSRLRGQMECPSDFQMIATGNLCPCGGLPAAFRGDIPLRKFRCRCHPVDVENYFKRISGPILDRIDLSVIMTEIEQKFTEKTSIECAKTKIKEARNFAIHHFGAISSDLSPQWLEANLPKKSSIEKILGDVMSLRSRHKILRVARSIQALENSPSLQEEHVFEAKWYRVTLAESA